MMRRSVALLVIGCLGGCSGDWPPQCGDEPMGEGFPSPTGTGDAWTYMYRSRDDADTRKDPIGTVVLMNEREYELPFNVFEMEPERDVYVESQFEVLYADSTRTQIRAVKANGDGIALLKGDFDPRRGRDYTMKLVVPGTRVRCGDAVYEIRREGWFLNGELKREF